MLRYLFTNVPSREDNLANGITIWRNLENSSLAIDCDPDIALDILVASSLVLELCLRLLVVVSWPW
jgi:hypothetical protein